MSRYVTKPHGLVIGSGNVFFYRDEQDEFQDFVATVGVRSYFFDNYSTLHVGIRTPAEQMVFDPVVVEEVKEYKDTSWTEERTFYRLKSWWVSWLDDNCPGWGYPPPKNADRVPSLFFARRKDALAFTNKVAEALQGMVFM